MPMPTSLQRNASIPPPYDVHLLCYIYVNKKHTYSRYAELSVLGCGAAVVESCTEVRGCIKPIAPQHLHLNEKRP